MWVPLVVLVFAASALAQVPPNVPPPAGGNTNPGTTTGVNSAGVVGGQGTGAPAAGAQGVGGQAVGVQGTGGQVAGGQGAGVQAAGGQVAVAPGAGGQAAVVQTSGNQGVGGQGAGVAPTGGGTPTQRVPYRGPQVGELNGAPVYVVNDTTLQIVGFSFKQQEAKQHSFGFKASDEGGLADRIYVRLTEPNSGRDFLKPINGLDIGSHNNAHVIIRTPQLRPITDFTVLSIITAGEKQEIATMPIQLTQPIPQPQKTGVRLQGSKYNVGSGEIVILSTKSFLLPNFTFAGDQPPDGFIFAGQDPARVLSNEGKTLGHKLYVRGWDNGPQPVSMKKPWTGDAIVTDLPTGVDISDVNFIGVYCYQVGVDFGHVQLPAQISTNLPPYVPPLGAPLVAWEESVVQGVQEFDFSLGSPGGERGYKAQKGALPNEEGWVWYVNGEMAPTLVMERGKTYRMKVRGAGKWQIYVSNDGSGGLNRKPAEELPLIKVFSRQETPTSKLCYFRRRNLNKSPDDYETFQAFKAEALFPEECNDANLQPAVLEFTPGPPDQMPAEIFYGSLDYYNMGGKIRLI